MSKPIVTYRLIRTISILFILLSESLQAQTPTMSRRETDILMGRFESRFQAMDSLIQLTGNTVLSTLSEQSLEHQRIEEIDRAVQAGIKADNSRNGLELSGHLYARPLSHMGYDSDEPTAAYTAKAQLELRWNVLQSSIVNRTLRIRQLQLEGEMEQLQYEKEHLARIITDYKLELRNQYNTSACVILEQHSLNMDMIVQAQQHMLRSGDIPGSALPDQLQRQSDVNRKLTIARSETPQPARSAILPVVIELDSARIIEHIRNSHLDIKALNLELELADCRTQSVKWFEQASLYPFVRYSWYSRTSKSSMNNLDAGVGFSIPLTLTNRNRRRVQQAQEAVLEYRRQQVSDRVIHEVTAIIEDINSCNQSLLSQQQRMNDYRAYLETRNAGYRALDGQYDRLTRLEEYNILLTMWEDLLDYAYRRDLKMADLQSYLTDIPVSTFFNTQNQEL